MNQSTELKDVMLQLYEALPTGNTAALKGLLSSKGDVLIIGTDPNEWWADPETILRVHQAQFQETGGRSQIKAGDLTAFAEGTVGWVADRPTFQLSNGQTLPIRVTAIFHDEAGQWKLVQCHISIGVPNVEIVGIDLTVS